jgi:hypothetical protein
LENSWCFTVVLLLRIFQYGLAKLDTMKTWR